MSFYAAPALLAKAHSALRLVASLVLRDDSSSVAEIADSFGLCRSRAYQLLDQALAALCPLPPGPAPGFRDLARAQDRIAQLEAENASLRGALAQAHRSLDSCVQVTERKLDQLNLVLAHHKVSVDASAEILRLAFDGRARGPSWLHERRQQLGRVARCLLDEARAQVCQRLRVVAADDIFLHRLPVGLPAILLRATPSFSAFLWQDGHGRPGCKLSKARWILEPGSRSPKISRICHHPS